MPPRQPPLFHLLLYLLSSNRLSDLLAETTRLQLGTSVPLVWEVSAVVSGRCACGEVMDKFGYHYLACNMRGMFTHRHDAVQDVVYEMLRKVFDPASVRRTHVYHLSYFPRWRPDITVLNYDGRERHLLIDVVIGFPCDWSHVEGAGRVPLHTAAAAERQKALVYGNVAPHKLGAGGGREAAEEWSQGGVGQRRHDGRLGEQVESAGGGTARGWFSELRAPLPARPLVGGPVFEELESPPVRDGLAGLLGTPGGLQAPSVVDNGSGNPGVAAACGADGVGSAHEEVADVGGGGEQDGTGLVSRVGSPQTSERLADVLSTPRPSAGMERQAFVGPLFRPVEDEWCGHTMACMPPTSAVTADYEAAFCPMILETEGWESAFPNLPRDEEWTRVAGELWRVLRDAGVTWETVAGVVVEEGRGPFHFTRQQQEELVGLDQVVGQEIQQYAANMVAGVWREMQSLGRLPGASGSRGYTRPRGVEMVGQRLRLCYFRGPWVRVVTEYVSDRGRHVVQFDDDGSCAPVDLSNSRPPNPVPVVEALVEEAAQRARAVGAAKAATALPADVVWATCERSAGDEGGRRRYVPGVPQLRRRPEQQQKVQEEWQPARQEWQERLRQRRQILQEWWQPWPQQADGRDARAVVRARRVRRTAAAHDGDPQPGEDDPAFRCPPTLAYLLRKLSGDNEDFWRLLGVATRTLLAPQPRARKKSIPVELVRVRVQQMLAGEWEGLYRAVVPSAPVWPARASDERIVSDVISLVKEGQLGKAMRRLDPGVLAPLKPETLEALEALHPGGDGLPAPVRVALLVLEEAAVEAECRQVPSASWLCSSSLQVECDRLPVERCLGDWQARWIRSAEGTQHGDPLGPFFMAVALQPVLQAVLRAHPGTRRCTSSPTLTTYSGRAGACEGSLLQANFQDVLDAAGDSIPGADVALEGIKVQLLLLRYCSHPRFMHVVRGVKSHTLMFGSLEHDDSGVQRCLQEIAGSPYPLGEAAVALSQLPTRRGGAWADLRPAAGAGGLAGVQGACVEAHGGDVPSGAELTPPPGSPGGHPLVACLVSAMEDVRGRGCGCWRRRPLGIMLPLVREVSAAWTGRCACGGEVDEFGYHCLTCNRRGMFAHRHNAAQDVLVAMLRKVYDPASVKKTHV
ncbi:hypothetical protein CYMTET_9661 [Cymbomonas tetramitiformis]|uniref:Uncharacterized protein n=1 Tax=Cymbomonas tetramitiformis TaxID=36881 RepID=A0AAE0GR32_9CHLO|nr:hypothetical protein CYMTET_9661 [Cymbomonas tetramitiformis]